MFWKLLQIEVYFTLTQVTITLVTKIPQVLDFIKASSPSMKANIHA